jgi:hypothetical protein
VISKFNNEEKWTFTKVREIRPYGEGLMVRDGILKVNKGDLLSPSCGLANVSSLSMSHYQEEKGG